MLIPDNELAKYGYLAVSGDKEGGLWFTDRTNLGGHNTSCDPYPPATGLCNCPQTQYPDSNIQTYWIGGGYNQGPLVHNNPAYWDSDYSTHPAENFIYVAPYGSQLTQYQLCGLLTDTQPICSRTTPKGSVDANGHAITFPWGLTPSVSAANGGSSADAIVWALSVEDTVPGNPESTVPGGLFAFDALTMQELYANTNCSGDAIAAATKNSIPTVANGAVYVGAESLVNRVNNGTGTFYIFAPNASRACN